MVSYNYSYQMGDIRLIMVGFHQITLGFDLFTIKKTFTLQMSGREFYRHKQIVSTMARNKQTTGPPHILKKQKKSCGF